MGAVVRNQPRHNPPMEHTAVSAPPQQDNDNGQPGPAIIRPALESDGEQHRGRFPTVRPPLPASQGPLAKNLLTSSTARTRGGGGSHHKTSTMRDIGLLMGVGKTLGSDSRGYRHQFVRGKLQVCRIEGVIVGATTRNRSMQRPWVAILALGNWRRSGGSA
jgi:hypothetical protein